jgi:hypothetical protein
MIASVMAVAATAGADFEKLPLRSAFGAEKLARDPFSAVDGVNVRDPTFIQLGSENVDEVQLPHFFRVTAFSIDRLSIALINGTAVAEGETFTVQIRSGKLRLRLLKVKQNGVVLKSSGTIFNVPLAR